MVESTRVDNFIAKKDELHVGHRMVIERQSIEILSDELVGFLERDVDSE
jgi:hypothetical protein